jgi:GntR family transcriptional regulator/MocR family aminotransferase
MELHVSLTRAGRYTSDVYEQLREAILDGRLRAGEKLPATRELARSLRVARNTVINAYQRLIAEGFAAGRAGAGTFVNAPERLTPRRAPSGTELEPRAMWRSLAHAGEPHAAAAYDFSIGVPDPALFPTEEWRSRIARRLRRRPKSGRYPAPHGDPALRRAIARHVGSSRSVRAGAEDVIVTGGAQQASDLIARVLIEPGDRVAVEDPGYPAAERAFRANGARIAPVRVDSEGLDVARLPDDAKLVYVTPSHQFPLGTVMSLPRRLALLSWAERHRAAILEDDYDSEFRFDDRPLEPLQSLDRRGRVLYVGTFSKVLLPTLRLGFIVAPASLFSSLGAAKALADSHEPEDAQLALADFIDDGMFARHLRRLVRAYRERRELLIDALQRHLAGDLLLLPSSAGLHLSVYFADRRVATHALIERAREESIAIQSLQSYYRGRPRAGLAIGYGAIPARKVEAGVRKLAACVRESGHLR